MDMATTVNGVAVDKLMETIELRKAQPELGEFKFRTRNRWVDGTYNRAENPPFYGAGAEDTGRQSPHVHDIDEPPILVGEDRGANPVEYLLAGLSGCVTTTFIAYAAAQGVKIDELRTELEGDIDVRGSSDDRQCPARVQGDPGEGST
jgi:organic hydroperoxide reductase OsmC/OhrA